MGQGFAGAVPAQPKKQTAAEYQEAMNREATRRMRAQAQAATPAPPPPAPTLWEKAKDLFGFGKATRQLDAAAKR